MLGTALEPPPVSACGNVASRWRLMGQSVDRDRTLRRPSAPWLCSAPVASVVEAVVDLAVQKEESLHATRASPHSSLPTDSTSCTTGGEQGESFALGWWMPDTPSENFPLARRWNGVDGEKRLPFESRLPSVVHEDHLTAPGSCSASPMAPSRVSRGQLNRLAAARPSATCTSPRGTRPRLALDRMSRRASRR